MKGERRNQDGTGAPAAVRCAGDHPRRPGSPCRALLAEIGEGVDVQRAGTLQPGELLLRCRRCGAEWILTPRPAAA